MSDHVKVLKGLLTIVKSYPSGFYLPRLSVQLMQREANAIRALIEENEQLHAALIPAEEWMTQDGCDCGTGELGTCALCLVREVLRGEE